MISATDRTLLGDTYHFIGIQAPDYVKDKTKQRLARSHAVKQALQKKRKLQQDCGDHFRITVDTDKPRRTPSKRTHTTNVPALLFSPCAGSLDPFQTLPVDQSRLQALLGNCKLLLGCSILIHIYQRNTQAYDIYCRYS